MADSHLPPEESRFDTASWAVLCGAILILALSLTQMLYRKSLPTDGWALDHYLVASKGQLVYATNISEQTSPLKGGDVLVSIEGQTAESLLGRALTLHPQLPEQWEVGQVARYEVLRDGRELALDVPLQQWAESIPGNILYALWYNASILPQLLIASFVFWRKPRNHAARLLLLLSAAFFADGAFNQTIAHRITELHGIALSAGEMFYRGAFWPMQFFCSLIWPMLTIPLYAHLFLSFPRRKRVVGLPRYK
jgi:hypothetical protein